MALFGGPTTPASRLEELKRLVQKDPTSRQFLALAEEYRRHAKYRDAVITLERGLQLHTTSVAGHVALGKTYQQLDRLDDAIRAFTKALGLDRENLVAIRQLAEVYLAKGEKVEAIKKLKLFRGLKAGDRDVDEIIQKLETELAAAVAERPRSDVQRAVSEPPEAPRSSPYTSSGIRRAVTIPRLDPVPAPPPAPPPPAENLPIEASDPIAPPPDADAPAPAHFTAPIVFVSEEQALEKAPFALDKAEAEADVPEEEATAPFTFPVDLYRTEAATRPFGPPAETAPFDVSDEGSGAPAPAEVFVSETLADLYRAQGHMADAREAYRSLAETAADEQRARTLREKAAALPLAERTDHPRLRRLVRRFPKRQEVSADQLHGLLSNLVEGTEGVRAATLTDLEGLPIVVAGPSARDVAMETLVAEVSSFLKGVRRTTDETGAGDLESLTVTGPKGGAVVSRVNADYSLILQIDPEAALGEVRWKAARVARALRPAVR
jgi:predicted regulator of Ras-like GTPase activity (Roadblock/LC7/MglB family)/tetratricopeptide (TPR) repeat protein